MSAITAKASRKMKKYAVLTREPRCFLGSFDFSWEQRKAIDIADYSKGNGYSKGDLTDAGTPIILYGRLYTKYQFAISEVDTFAVPRNGAVYSQGNEVIVPASGETAEDIARASAVEKSGVLLGGDLNILRPFDFINPLFLALAISNGEPQKELAKKAQGKSVVHIHNTDIQEVTIAYPSRTEQDRIVSVFRQLDHLITLHQRECISFTARAGRLILTATKKRNTSSWEQRKLGELCNITTGKLDANAMVSDGQYDFYTSGIDVFKIDVAAFEGPAITIAGNGASVGYMHLADGKFNAYQRTYVLTDFLADRQFLNVAIGNELPDKIQEEVRGSGIPYIVLNMLTDLTIPFPSHEEQYAIGVYFQQLDNLITLHQRKPFLMKWRTSDANRNQTNRLVL